MLESLLAEQASKVRKLEPKKPRAPRQKCRWRCCTPGCGEEFTTEVACEAHPHRRIEQILTIDTLGR